jgi:hypothetical protein
MSILILDRLCPLWSMVKGTPTPCFEGCAWFEGWTVMNAEGVEPQGTCILFNLRFLDQRFGDDDDCDL